MPDLLQNAMTEHIGDRAEGFVFRNRFGDPYDPSTVGKNWKKLLKQHDLPEHITLHGARHTFIDMLYNSNKSIREDTVMQLVGHSSRAMTRSYRQNVEQTHAETAMGAIEMMVSKQDDADDDVVDVVEVV